MQDELDVAFLGQLGAVGGWACRSQPPGVVGVVGGAGQAADVGFTVVYDRSELEVAEGVPAELAPRGQESHRPSGRVVPVREMAVHSGRFEKLPIHDARTYHCDRTCVRLDTCGVFGVWLPPGQMAPSGLAEGLVIASGCGSFVSAASAVATSSIVART